MMPKPSLQRPAAVGSCISTLALTMNRLILLLLGLAIGSCSASANSIDSEIAQQTSRNASTLDFTKFATFAWERVCFFGPYSDNDRFTKATGFSWPLIKETGISSSDSTNVLVFVNGRSVAAYTEYPRQQADFWRLSGQCFNKEQSKFIKQSGNYIYASLAPQSLAPKNPALALLGSTTADVLDTLNVGQPRAASMLDRIDNDHPILNLDSIDVHLVKKASGSILVIITDSPLANDQKTLDRLFEKVRGYLRFINSQSYIDEYGEPTHLNTQIVMLMHEDSDDGLMEHIDTLSAAALKYNTAFIVQMFKDDPVIEMEKLLKVLLKLTKPKKESSRPRRQRPQPE